MLDFLKLIQCQNFVWGSNIQKILSRLPESLDNDGFIDTLWNEVETYTHYQFSNISLNTLRGLKNDIFMSLYVAAKYATLEPIKFTQIPKLLKGTDSEQYAENNKDSKKSGSYYYRDELKKIFPSNGLILIPNQYRDLHRLSYLEPYWDESSNELKCFDIEDFMQYIYSYTCWPLNPQYCFGMPFYKYFSGIHKMTNKWNFYSDDPITTADFKTSLSAYILEQLFAPISFIQNVNLHISAFKDIFPYYKKPDRERTLVLMQPLFGIPKFLWENMSEEHTSLVKRYVVNSDENALEFLAASMKNIVYYSQYVFTYFKVLLANILYTRAKNSMAEIANVLEKYIKDNSKDFNYFTPLYETMRNSVEYYYPKSPSSKSEKLSPIDIEGYNLFKLQHPDSLSKDQSKKKQKKSSSEDEETQKTSTEEKSEIKPPRNSPYIETYEINFTYYFFSSFYSQQYCDWFLQTSAPHNSVFDNFSNPKIQNCISSAKNILNALQTLNYLAQPQDSITFPIR